MVNPDSIITIIVVYSDQPCLHYFQFACYDFKGYYSITAI